MFSAAIQIVFCLLVTCSFCFSIIFVNLRSFRDHRLFTCESEDKVHTKQRKALREKERANYNALDRMLFA